MTIVDVPPVNVRLIEDTTKAPKQVRNIRATFSQVTVGTGLGALMVLGHAPNRIRAILQITTGQCWLGEDQNAVKKADNATANMQAFAGVVYLETTNEVWAFSTVAACNIAVIQEFEDCAC
jgi:hypothetical protein